MSYYTGTAATKEAIVTALVNSCLLHGWTWDNDILSKGDSHFEITTATSSVYDRFQIRGTTAAVGGTFGDYNYFREMNNELWTFHFPMTYHIFVYEDPDEVYLILNFQIGKYAWLHFGTSNRPGISGTGAFYGAIHGHWTSNSAGAAIGTRFYIFSGTANENGSSVLRNYYIHCGIDPSNPWRPGVTASTNRDGQSALTSLLGTQPQNFSGESVLLPAKCFGIMAASKRVILAELQYARFCRITNYEPEEVISYGHEQWKVFPWMAKNLSESGHPNIFTGHSGTHGAAFKM